jgi:hypothetical protein
LTLDLPIVLYNAALKYTGKTLWACGRYGSAWVCYSLLLSAWNTWSGAYTSNFDHPNVNAIWVSDTIMTFCTYEGSFPPQEYFNASIPGPIVIKNYAVIYE